MNEEKRWKRGDIGPDGRVFWGYRKDRKNGEHWVGAEAFQIIKSKQNARNKSWARSNPDKIKIHNAASGPKARAKRIFAKYDGSTPEKFSSCVKWPMQTFRMVQFLTPAPGQTLAELIHELSGYPMDTCEQIANPPEPEKLDNPTTTPTLPAGLDLF